MAKAPSARGTSRSVSDSKSASPNTASNARKSTRAAKEEPKTAAVKAAKNIAASAVARELSAGTPSRLPNVRKAEPKPTKSSSGAAPKAAARTDATKAVAKSAQSAAPASPASPTRPSAAAKPVVETKLSSRLAATAAKVAPKSSNKSSAQPASAASEPKAIDGMVEPKPDTKADAKSTPKGGMTESTRRAIAAASPRKVVDEPPARQLGLRATRPEEVANVRPLEARTTRPTEGRAPKGSADINGYNAAVRYLLERTDFERMRAVKYNEATFKLDRMHQLLSKLGNPHQHIRTVHVAGTNGKGSTVAMIASMLQACGYAVGVYTSPHLVDMRERIQINGQSIEKAAFAEAIKQVAKAAEKAGVEPTFFEAVTAACFKYFAEQAVDIAVIEVGLGGRLDSTNVIRPEACVITSIDFDHVKLLGNTLEEIAREKAGIFKKDVPAFIFESEPAVEKAIAEVAEQAGAPLRIVNKDIDYSARFCVTEDLGPHTRVCLYTKNSRLEHLPVPLQGEHQAANCGLALAVVDHLKTVGFDCPEDKLTAGLAATRVPGRMQLVWDRPRVLVDGAHNPAAVGALMRCAGAHVPYDSMICVFGCCSDKNVHGLIDKVNLGADKVIFTRAAGNPRSADPEDLQKLFNERSGKMSQVAKTLPEALEMATRAVSREDLVCVTGSFYLVGETLKHLQHFDRSKGGKIPAQIPQD